MVFSLASLSAAILPVFAGLLAPPGNSIELKRVVVVQPPHLTAADQCTAPGIHAPVLAFDGNPATAWWLPPAASGEGGYSVHVEFAHPATFDQVRVLIEPPAAEPEAPPVDPKAAAKAAKAAAKAARAADAAKAGKPARLTRVELAFWDSTLSTKTPIYKRMLNISPDRPTADLGLPAPLKWNSDLINDEDAGDRRRARGLGDTIPFPLSADAITLSVQEIAPGDRAPSLAEVSFMLGGAPLPVSGSDGVEQRHLAYVEAGIRHIIEGRYFVAKEHTFFFEKGGALWEIPAKTWAAGDPGGKGHRRLGDWRVDHARFEVKTAGKFEPVDYTLDDAPQSVILRTKPISGTFAVAVAPPAPASGAPANEAAVAPTLTNQPGYEPPPLVE